MNPFRLGVVVLVALVLQVCLFSRFAYEGARPDVMILVAIAAGLVAGAERGALVGFAAGLAYDVLLTTPLGLSALVYCLVGYAAGASGSGVLRASRWVAPVMAATASAAGMFAYALVGSVFGLATFRGPAITDIVVVVASVNAVLAPLAVRVLRWARLHDADRRHQPLLYR